MSAIPDDLVSLGHLFERRNGGALLARIECANKTSDKVGKIALYARPGSRTAEFERINPADQYVFLVGREKAGGRFAASAGEFYAEIDAVRDLYSDLMEPGKERKEGEADCYYDVSISCEVLDRISIEFAADPYSREMEVMVYGKAEERSEQGRRTDPIQQGAAPLGEKPKTRKGRPPHVTNRVLAAISEKYPDSVALKAQLDAKEITEEALAEEFKASRTIIHAALVSKKVRK